MPINMIQQQSKKHRWHYDFLILNSYSDAYQSTEMTEVGELYQNQGSCDIIRATGMKSSR